MPLPRLSIVTTMYRSAAFVPEFYRRITEAATMLSEPYELIFVNDGSPDDSVRVAMELADADDRVRVVDLSRNFGHHAAALAGLRHAHGQFVFLIDVDLEEQPEWLIDFWEDLHSRNADMVYGVQYVRSDSGMRHLASKLFYALFNAASETPIPTNVCTVRLMNRAYVDTFTRFTEPHLYLAGLYSWAGFSQQVRYVNKTRRPSKSTYTPLKLIRLFVDAITSFSSYPLTIFFFMGFWITVLSILMAGRLLIIKIIRPEFILSGYASIMVSLWFLGGVIISILGLIGMYVGKIFIATKSRPQYLVRRVYERAAGISAAQGATDGIRESRLSH